MTTSANGDGAHTSCLGMLWYGKLADESAAAILQLSAASYIAKAGTAEGAMTSGKMSACECAFAAQ